MRYALLSFLLPAFYLACGSDGNDDTTGSGGTTASSSSVSVSSSVSASSNVSSSSNASSSSAASSSSTGSSCMDTGQGEPNDTEGNAHDLGTIPDDDDGGVKVLGVVKGNNDTDWYKYLGEDNIGAFVGPERTLTQSENGIRVCKFAECASGIGETTVTCDEEAGQTAETSPAGRPGCCAQGDLVLDLECGGIDDGGTIVIRIDQPSASATTCNAYTLDIHY